MKETPAKCKHFKGRTEYSGGTGVSSSYIIQLPLETDRSTVNVSLSFCKPNCLMRQYETFVSALGRPRGGFIYRTALDTVIKRRSHTSSGRRFLGFDIEKHRAAFEILR